MADRGSAFIYGSMFRKLAADPTPQHVRWAKALWRDSFEYDFSPEQMYCDAALRKLGLAKRGLDPEYPEDGQTWIYADDKARLSRHCATSRRLPKGARDAGSV